MVNLLRNNYLNHNSVKDQHMNSDIQHNSVPVFYKPWMNHSLALFSTVEAE